MTPELSRRLAWIMQFWQMSPEEKYRVIDDAIKAQSFENLPKDILDKIVELEKQHGKNPAL